MGPPSCVLRKKRLKAFYFSKLFYYNIISSTACIDPLTAPLKGVSYYLFLILILIFFLLKHVNLISSFFNLIIPKFTNWYTSNGKKRLSTKDLILSAE